jgi:hypothetical protein
MVSLMTFQEIIMATSWIKDYNGNLDISEVADEKWW